MSIIIDDPAPLLAARLRKERQSRSWSLALLAERSGVSKGMLSKIEREEASPTASVLVRIATAFGLTLAELLTPIRAAAPRLLRREQQPLWRDPATHYVRRQVFLSAQSPLELVEVKLPGGVSASFSSSSYVQARHVAWVLAGRLTIIEGAEVHDLNAGDRLEFGAPADVTYRNAGAKPCRYLVALLRV
jgi:transcriptional regulator with XRE-family HTH domain